MAPKRRKKSETENVPNLVYWAGTWDESKIALHGKKCEPCKNAWADFRLARSLQTASKVLVVAEAVAVAAWLAGYDVISTVLETALAALFFGSWSMWITKQYDFDRPLDVVNSLHCGCGNCPTGTEG